MIRSQEEFVRAVEERTGLKMNEIPDADMDIPLSGGVMVINSRFGELWFYEFSHRGEDGNDIYQFASIVGRAPGLPPANATARGDMLLHGRQLAQGGQLS